MNQRGHLLVFLATIVAAALFASVVVTNRISRSIEDRAAEEVRTQALWLARSALDAGVVGTRRVTTASGVAVVRARAASVDVDLAGARATASKSPPRERFTAAGR